MQVELALEDPAGRGELARVEEDPRATEQEPVDPWIDLLGVAEVRERQVALAMEAMELGATQVELRILRAHRDLARERGDLLVQPVVPRGARGAREGCDDTEPDRDCVPHAKLGRFR